MRLFSQGGFNSVSLADIAAEVGITQAGVLHYYPTKAALLLAVLQERELRNQEAALAGEAEGIDPLTAYFNTLEDNDHHPELVKLFVILAAEATADAHPGHQWFIERNDELLSRTMRNVEHVIDPALLPEGIDVEVIARWLLALAHGLGAQWVYDTSAFPRTELVKRFMILLRPYLRQPN
jgi:AcrR family transcriptional regulator